MEIIYKASTGLEFNSAAACQLYELWQDSPEMGWPEFIIANISRINEIVHGSTVEIEQGKVQSDKTEASNKTEETEVDWKTVKEGTLICVRDNKHDYWRERIFMAYDQYKYYRFICKDDFEGSTGWKYAKLTRS